MKRNKLRELIDEGKPTVGTHLITPWSGMVEVIGHSGAFDYIEYAGEYSPFSLEHLDNFGRAIELFPKMSSMIKLEEQGRGFVAQRAIGAGIQNVLFADCRSAQDVRECIRIVRPETPEAKGVHGCSMRRNVGYLLEVGSKTWTDAMNDVVIAIMIEKKAAMDNLEEILSVDGIDMVTFGPGDYSISIGKPGQRDLPEVQKAQRDVIELTLRKGLAPRVEATNFEQIKPFLEMGVRHFCIGTDLRIIYEWCGRQAESIRELFARYSLIH